MKSAPGLPSAHCMRASAWRACAAVSACLALACGGTPDAPPAPKPRGVAPIAEATTEVGIEPTVAPYETGHADPLQPSAAIEPSKADEKPEEKRDIGKELLQMMSGATSCLKPRVAAAAFTHVDIALTANVTPSGAVSRGEASSPLLGADELACIRGQIEALHFADPIENAPFAVSATLGIDQAPPPPAAAPAAADAPPSGTEQPNAAPEAAPSAP